MRSDEATGDAVAGTSSRRVRLSADEAWAAVIGPRGASRYRRRFAELSRPGASRFGWHWAACLVPPFWFLYRKMWGWAAIYLVGVPALIVADAALTSPTLSLRIALDSVGLLMLVGALVAPGVLADRLYLDHCNRVIRATRRDGPRHRYLARLAARGGTSDAAATVAAVVAGFAVLGVAGGLGLAVWIDYGKREKVVDALRMGAGARHAVAGFVDRRGTIPTSWEEAGVQWPALPAHVARVDLDPRTGTIDIETRVSPTEAGALRLVPQVDERERIVWTCRADPAIEPFSPRSCRGGD